MTILDFQVGMDETKLHRHGLTLVELFPHHFFLVLPLQIPKHVRQALQFLRMEKLDCNYYTLILFSIQDVRL